MCGIVGYTGEASATPSLVEGLTRMEYRGYDSAGVAVEQDGGIQVITRKGKVADVCICKISVFFKSCDLRFDAYRYYIGRTYGLSLCAGICLGVYRKLCSVYLQSVAGIVL